MKLLLILTLLLFSTATTNAAHCNVAAAIRFGDVVTVQEVAGATIVTTTTGTVPQVTTVDEETTVIYP